MAVSEKIRQVPTHPGVYLFKDTEGNIIYIGKAKNLRNRVRSYFQKNKYQTPKNQSMIRRIFDLEWIVVRTEVEALLTEANLIKEHVPKYNVDLKDDKSYPFIRITKEPFPQVLLTREIVHDGSKYYGPFTDVRLLRRTLKALNQVFTIRSCSYILNEETIRNGKVKICLDYHIKKCKGPCEGLVSEDEYALMVKRVSQFLQGKTRETEQQIAESMNKASEEMRFEDAGAYRDQLQAIRSFRERQRKVAADFADRDVFALVQDGDIGVIAIIRIRNGRIFSREKIKLRNAGEEDPIILKSVMTRFYMNSDFIPREISLPEKPENEKDLMLWLRKKKGRVVTFIYPQKGEKAREIRMAYQNAKLLLGEWQLERKRRREFIPQSLQQLQDDLQLKAPPRRIEAFDISHLGGTNTVASMVCFKDGKPRKSQYRKYKVKTVSGIDDFAAIREVVLRRYRRMKDEQGNAPDLILIDGGKGQLSMALSALRELGLDYIPVIGLAKRLEEVFIPGFSEPQSIPKQSSGLFMLRKIRDEAHRFAITFQRERRSKDMTRSVFADLQGMGPVRVARLFKTFENLETIAGESPGSIMEKTRIPEWIAETVIERAQDILRDKGKVKR